MNAPGWKTLFGTGFLACLFAAGFTAGSTAARAQQAGKPILLVASPSLQGPYQHTTLIAVPVADKHIGFILNRATDVKLSTLFPGHAPAAKVTDPVRIGGPEMMQTLFALVRRDPGGQALQLSGDLFVTGRAEAIDRIIKQTPNDARYFVGFVGWSAGELESEIGRGLWYLAEPDVGLVFNRETNGMWEELVKRLGGNPRPPLGRGFIETRFDLGN